MMVRYALLLSVCVALLPGMAAPTLAAEPQLTILGPTDQERVSTPDVQVTFLVTGLTVVPSSVPLAEEGQHPEANRPGEGHLHFMLDVQPPVVWHTTDPYTLSNVPPGRHRLMVELVNNDHSSLSPPVVQEVAFERLPRALPNTGQAASPDTLWLLGMGGLLAGVGAYLRRRGRASTHGE